SGHVFGGSYGRGVARLNGSVFSPHWTNAVYVQSLLTDSRGRIWVGSFGQGVSVYDARGELVRSFQQFSGDNVTALSNDAEGTIWVGGSAAMLAIRDEGTLAPGPHQRWELPSVVCFAFEPERRFVWAGTDSGLFRIDGAHAVEERDA